MKHFPLDNDQLTKFLLPLCYSGTEENYDKKQFHNASNFATASYHVATVPYLQVIQPLNSRL